MEKIANDILDMIGGTPLVPVRRVNPNADVEILAKLEYFNPGGSVKDRPALFMIKAAEEKGELTKDKIILEATSGNTGIGLALVAAVKGYRIMLTMSESVSEERVKILQAMGAEVKFTPAHLATDGAIEYVYRLIREEPEKYWLADQFNNEANWRAHYNGTALEIWEQTHGDLDAVVATMGTGGTLMGLARRFEELDSRVRIVGVEPYMGHKIQGLKNMKESYQPGIFERNRLHRVANVDDEEAYGTARLLAKEEGMFVGMSSGAAMAAALRVAEEMTSGRIVVILPDGGERYLSTCLFVTKRKSGLRIFNTLTRDKDEFIPQEENRVSLFSSGPTLCHPIHLGQCRPFVFADLMRRYLEFKGYEVTHVMNLTDLDDRTIEGAQEAQVSLKEFTNGHYHAFMDDLARLNIRKASEYPRASEHVDDMIALTEKLMEKGFAYEKFRSIYFDISRFKDYGRLSRIDLKKIKLGKTVDLDLYEKENPRDFTLLKRSTLNELKRGVFFQTKWGNVRPGWHLQSAAMAMKCLGTAYDIHASGVDQIFPHHENAIAIVQALTGTPPAGYWIHNELVMVDGASPSRVSQKDSLFIENLLQKGFSGREVRYWLLSRHYRKPALFSWKTLEAVKGTVARLDAFVQKLHFCPESSQQDPDVDQAAYDLRHGFVECMDDDFNISGALASLFRFTRRLNTIIDKKGLSVSDREKALKVMRHIDSVLGVMDLEAHEIDEETKGLIQKRDLARREKDWSEADRLREEIRARGFEVIDTTTGPGWRRL